MVINRDEELVTRDYDFKYISGVAMRLGYVMKLKII